MSGSRMRKAAVTLLLAVVSPVTPAGLDRESSHPGLGVPVGEAATREPTAPAERAARRRWALGKMDEMARERQRCRERFRAPRQVAECEAEYARRYREYNETYLDLSRE